MPDSAIYSKTHKGVEEISHRTHRLASRLRSALIVIDGHTPWDELQKRLMIGDAADETLRTLLAEGYIESIDDEPPTVIEM